MADESTAPHREDRDELTARIAQRKKEITERLGRLRGTLGSLGRRDGRGSTADDVAAAQQAADVAQRNAAAAHTHAARGHERAARTHEDAADLFDTIGEDERARHHRAAAAEDRDGATADHRQAREDSPTEDSPTGHSTVEDSAAEDS
jgi:hypothetical protein